MSRWTDEPTVVVPRCHPELTVERLGDEALVHDPRTGTTTQLNATAWPVLQDCDGVRTTRDLASLQVERFDIDIERALDHIEQLVMTFNKIGLLDLAE